MAAPCIQKAQRPELKRYCGDFSTQEQARMVKLQNWLAEWYRSKPDPTRHRKEHSSEQLEHFVTEMRSATGEKFEQVFLPGLRLRMAFRTPPSVRCVQLMGTYGNSTRYGTSNREKNARG